MQVTIKDYDESSHTGTVLTDDGIEVAFGADAMATNGLGRLARSTVQTQGRTAGHCMLGCSSRGG